jgi:4,5-dihydroxyphthalate decarboxylase
VNLNYLPLPPEETFWAMLRHREFDAAELSFSSYILSRSRSEDHFIAIPVFPSRSFRHSAIYVNAQAGIHHPQDLKGRRVGTPEYQMTAGVWARGHLQHEWGIAPSDIQWFTGGEEQSGRPEKLKLDLPDNMKVQPIGPTQTLNEMLLAGELDALISARTPTGFTNENGVIRRLFPNYREVETDYYRRTGIFPIMHTVVLRREIYEANRWLARALFRAFEQAKQICYRDMFETTAPKVMLPWITAEAESLRDLFGGDWWPYGLEPNRTTIEALVQYSFEQGLAKCLVEPSSLFAAEALDMAKI